MSREETRPWGKYEILYEGSSCKVKKITVNPGGCLSYQFHRKRSENWVIVEGNALVMIDDKPFKKSVGESVIIPALSTHMIENPDSQVDLVFIETQTGSYFGEDDIVRLQDKYGRVK